MKKLSCSCEKLTMAMAGNFNSFKKITTRAFSYLTPQPSPGLVAYTRYSLPHKYKYKRPAFLELDEDSTQASADHVIRPVMHPKKPLVMNTGYAEVINAGKTLNTNEDMSSFHSMVITIPLDKRDQAWTNEMCQIPIIYFAIFDGHAGTGAALAAYHNLHFFIKERLTDISHMLLLTQEQLETKYLTTGLITSIDAEKLIVGAIEKAFQAFDDEVKQQKYDFRIDGGCTAVVALFILEKLYLACAGDSRAVVYKDYAVELTTVDHSPESERRRIQTLALYKPALLHNEYTRYQFQHRCRSKDVGTMQLYRDHNMAGWALKTIDRNDMKPQLISGEGKRARLLDTIGTTRGFGDHDLEVPYCASIKIKPFMLATPEVYVYDLKGKEFGEDDVVVMGSDGLWEKFDNTLVGSLLQNKLSFQSKEEMRRYIVAAQYLTDEARGSLGERGWRMADNQVASYDDISVFVIPLMNWKNALDNKLQRHREETGRDQRQSVGLDEYYNIPHASPTNSPSTNRESRPDSTSGTVQKISEQNEYHYPQNKMEEDREKNKLLAIAKSYEQISNVDIISLKNSKHLTGETTDNDCEEIGLQEKGDSTSDKTNDKKRESERLLEQDSK